MISHEKVESTKKCKKINLGKSFLYFMLHDLVAGGGELHLEVNPSGTFLLVRPFHYEIIHKLLFNNFKEVVL